MEIVNFQKEASEQGGLRLVSDAKNLSEQPKFDKQFVSFQLLRVDPAWRRLDPAEKATISKEFVAVFDGFREQLLLFTYSLVGFDAKADLMFWRVGNSLDVIQNMTAELNASRFGGYLETVDNYMAATKNMMFVSGGISDRLHVVAGEKKYHFLYPCSKQTNWYEKTVEERDALIEENFMVGKRFSNISIHMTHAFGFSEQEWMISFETDEPRDFLALAEELKNTAATRFNVRGMPVYTCRQLPLSECISSVG